jgi:hypothetical protein
VVAGDVDIEHPVGAVGRTGSPSASAGRTSAASAALSWRCATEDVPGGEQNVRRALQELRQGYGCCASLIGNRLLKPLQSDRFQDGYTHRLPPATACRGRGGPPQFPCLPSAHPVPPTPGSSSALAPPALRRLPLAFAVISATRHSLVPLQG